MYLAQVGGKELSKVSGIKHESFIGKERKGSGKESSVGINKIFLSFANIFT